MKRTLVITTVAALSLLAAASTPAVADVINGTPGVDHLVGTHGKDSITGRGGDDRLFGRGGADGLFGGPGQDALFGGNKADDLTGGVGADYLAGGQGNDTMVDWLATSFAEEGGTGPADADKLLGADGADFIGFTDGRDRVRGGDGRDELRTENDAFADRIDCGAGRDVLTYFFALDKQDKVTNCEVIIVQTF
jgi:Ca2+-binding RTX toxin-like protein